MEDLKQICEVEARCFPAAEAAGEKEFRDRLKAFSSCFWLLYRDKELISFVDGMLTMERDLCDAMYEDSSMHREDGDWLMIFGVNTIPKERRKGCAGMLIREAIREMKERGKKGIVLTCKKEKISWYASFGFINEGVSVSTHGDVVWYQMRLLF